MAKGCAPSACSLIRTGSASDPWRSIPHGHPGSGLAASRSQAACGPLKRDPPWRTSQDEDNAEKPDGGANMTDEKATVEAGLQSEMISDVSATSASPLGPQARELDRIARIKALCGQFRKNSTELLLVAHRLGLEARSAPGSRSRTATRPSSTGPPSSKRATKQSPSSTACAKAPRPAGRPVWSLRQRACGGTTRPTRDPSPRPGLPLRGETVQVALALLTIGTSGPPGIPVASTYQCWEWVRGIAATARSCRPNRRFCANLWDRGFLAETPSGAPVGSSI